MKRQRALAAQFEELKFIDLSATQTAVASNVNRDAMSVVAVPRDTSASGRVGQKIAVKSIDFCFNIGSDALASLAAGSYLYSRSMLLAVVQIPQWQSSVLTAFPLVAGAGTTSVYDSTLCAQGLYVRDLDHTSKYKVLFVKLVTQLPRPIYEATSPIMNCWPNAQLRGRINFKTPVITEFAAADSTGAANATDRNMILMAAYNMLIAGGSSRDISVGLACRTRYYD